MSRLSVRYGSGQISFDVPAGNLAGILSLNKSYPAADIAKEVNRALDAPIGCDDLVKIAEHYSTALIIADDNTRLTPARDIVPPILARLNSAGIKDQNIAVLIALGTHRPMTDNEILDKFGTEVKSRIKIINHEFNNPDMLYNVGVTENGTPVSVNINLLNYDLVIGIGSIIPHHIPGFSGGAKIIQPGVCGAETTAMTHLLSVRSRRSMLGITENDVRNEMELIAKKVNARYIFNAVNDENGRLIKGFFGDMEMAFREGARFSREIYGLRASEKTDIVVASSYPCDLEFWQAHKALYACEAVINKNGTMIIVTPCPEGVAVMHPDILTFADQSPDEIDAQIKNGVIRDGVAGALALAWSKIRQYATVCIVSDGIDRDTAKKLGFYHFETVNAALEDAFLRHGSDARVTVLPSGGDLLPLIDEEDL